MALTAREWLLLPKEEQERRKDELSSHECYLLRTDLEYMRFSEDEKRKMPQEKRESILHPKKYTEKEKEIFNKQCQDIFESFLRHEKKASGLHYKKQIPIRELKVSKHRFCLRFRPPVLTAGSVDSRPLPPGHLPRTLPR